MHFSLKYITVTLYIFLYVLVSINASPLSQAEEAADLASRYSNQARFAGKNELVINTALMQVGLVRNGRSPQSIKPFMYVSEDILKDLGFYLFSMSEPTNPRKGDICVCVSRNNNYPNGRIAIFNGRVWISGGIRDFQRNLDFIGLIYCYRGFGTKIWLDEVNGYDINDENNGYSGIFGRGVTGLRVSGDQPYRVHIGGGQWLNEVVGNNIYDLNIGYSGTEFGNVIDAIAISGNVNYAVHIKGGDWLPAVNGYDIDDSENGYSGIIGKAIDAVMIEGRTYATSYNENY